MKKFLTVLAIAGTLIACDNAGSNEQRIKDSTDSVKTADSLRMEAEKMTPSIPDTTIKITDTTIKIADTTTKM